VIRFQIFVDHHYYLHKHVRFVTFGEVISEINCAALKMEAAYSCIRNMDTNKERKKAIKHF